MDRLLQPGAALMLALGAASVAVSGAAARGAALVNVLKDEDWLLADRWARAERAEGVLTRSLGGEEPERAQLTDRWARMGMVADFRQARLESGLSEALEVLREGGVRSMLLKGAALAMTAYEGGFPDRPMEDVDVLVPDAEASAAYELLRNAGWIAGSASTGAAFGSGRAGHHHLPQLRHSESGMVLELHRALLPPRHPFAWDEREIWRTSSESAVRGVATLVPAAEELLLHGAVHLAWAHELRIGIWGWVRDMAVLAPRVDWQLVHRLAVERRAESCLHWALRLGERLGGVQLPVGVLDPLRKGSRMVASRVERHLVLDGIPGGTSPDAVLLRRAGWRAAVRPVRSGHSSARPWSSAPARDSTRGGGAGADEGNSGAARLAPAGITVKVRAVIREIRRLPSWIAWCWRVLR